MNILITSASREVVLVRTFKEALRQEGGGKVVAADMSPFSPALYFADDYYLVPPSDGAAFLIGILRLCERLSIKLLVSPRDEEVVLFATHKEKFKEVGTTVMAPDRDVAEICQDKLLFIEFCKERGFGFPKTYETLDLSTYAEFPLFVKPRRGKGGRGAIRIDSKEELKVALNQNQDVIVQEFIRAPEYTIDLFADFTGKVISVVPRERLRVFGGESFVGKTSKDPTLIQESVRLATSLNLVGHNTIQCFLDNGVVKFTEVNPRFGGGAHLGFAAGAPTPLFLVKLLKGEILEPRIGEFRDNYVMLRYTEDQFVDFESLVNKASL